MTTQIKREHTGRMHLFVDGIPVPGALVTSITHSAADGKPYVQISIPVDKLTFGEVDNVVPLVRSTG